VLDVAEDSPAAVSGLQAGLQAETEAQQLGGDIITAINGEPVTGMDRLITYLTSETRPGDQVELAVIRDGQPETVTVTLAARPGGLAIEANPQNEGN
jgi:serine protease Do